MIWSEYTRQNQLRNVYNQDMESPRQPAQSRRQCNNQSAWKRLPEFSAVWAYTPKSDPEPVRVHDFAIPGLGKVAPYGVYDIAANAGWINLGITHDTAAFAVESIRRWWQELGQAQRLLITADRGITVAHLPPSTSKWNRIEHRRLHHPELAGQALADA
jgi:hypothetical protein